MKRPKSIEEYKKWAASAVHCDFEDERNSNLFETNCILSLKAAQNHPFFESLDDKLTEWKEEYRSKKGSALLMSSNTLDLQTKSFESFLDKSFRLNVVWNKDFPKEPASGWVNCNNAFASLNDLVRGTLVCRFIDGPAFLVEKLDSFAKELGLDRNHYPQSRDGGYYAHHFYAKIPVQLLDATLKSYEAETSVEIQVTTQLQDVLKEITHQLYEAERLQRSTDNKWKWEYGTNKFKVGYLGHTLHLLESVIVEARDFNLKKSRAKKKDGMK